MISWRFLPIPNIRLLLGRPGGDAFARLAQAWRGPGWAFLGLFLLVLLAPPALRAQQSVQDSSIRMAILDVTYRGQSPGGDMRQRYGFTSALGMDVTLKGRHNFYLVTGLSFLFSDSVNLQGALDPLLVPGGLIITDNGLLTDVRIVQSGLLVPLAIGKLFPIIPAHNPNSGLFVEAGVQFLQHRINITPRDEIVTALEGDYAKGYDRLTNGLGLRQAIGYRYVDNRGYVNLRIGLDFSQSFTQSRRSVDFSTGQGDTRRRLDLLSGFVVSWSFPLFNRAPNEAYYY